MRVNHAKAFGGHESISAAARAAGQSDTTFRRRQGIDQ
jgi:hypothetical protein